MAKSHRRFIRLNGELISSPRFTRKKDADEWFEKMRRKKGFMRDGFLPELEQTDIPTFMEFAAQWLQKRKQTHPAATWSADEYRLRLHLLPTLSEVPINHLDASMIENVILNTKNSKDNKETSFATKERLKALMSAVLKDALKKKLIKFNPARDVVFGSRVNRKKKLTNYISDEKKVEEFFLSARKESKRIGSSVPLVYAALALMAFPRRSEIIALKWSDIDFTDGVITISRIWESATRTIKERTKKGEGHFRDVVITEALRTILKQFWSQTKYSNSDDFVVTFTGRNISETALDKLHKRIMKPLGLKVTIHGLRHTAGSIFAQKSGNLRILQLMMGHSSVNTTEGYANLKRKQLKDAKHVLNFDVGSDH